MYIMWSKTMNMKIFQTMKNYKLNYLPKDILAGIIIAAVSIPISMGYAEVSGLPPVYGLYGSVLPILFFAMFTTSPQFIFGVDAAPAAIIGAAAAGLGLQAQSPEAMAFIKSRKDGRLHIYSGYGRFYQRNCGNDHINADSQNTGRQLRNGRTAGADRFHYRSGIAYQSGFCCTGDLFSGGDRCGKEAGTKVSYGDRGYGGGGIVDHFWSY